MDIIYAASPLILWSSNKLFPVTRIMLLPILDYANNATAKYGMSVPYNLTWAPHYLGHWPSECCGVVFLNVASFIHMDVYKCMVYGLKIYIVCDTPPDKQEQMPMEETGNMVRMWIVTNVLIDLYHCCLLRLACVDVDACLPGQT